MAEKEFELLGGLLCLDFLNTIHEYGAADPKEELHSFQDLVSFASQSGAITNVEAAGLRRVAIRRPAAADRALSSARECRQFLYGIFSSIAQNRSPSGDHLDALNRWLARIYGNLRIQNRNGDLRWTWKNAPDDLNRVLWPIFHSAAELLTTGQMKLVRECDSQTCTWLFLDHSKNRTRRWCDMKTCGNRAKWRRHYKRIKKKKDNRNALVQ